MKHTLAVICSAAFGFFNTTSCHAASISIDQQILPGETLVVRFGLTGVPEDNYDILMATVPVPLATRFDSPSVELQMADGLKILGVTTHGFESSAIGKLQLRSEANAFTTFNNDATQLADLSSLIDDGDFQGTLRITPKFTSPSGSIKINSISIITGHQVGENSIVSGANIEIFDTQIVSVPEPSTAALLIASWCCVILRRRRHLHL